jgi:predicted kinase
LKLIIFSGLPGTGKSTLAEAVGRELGIPVFAKDWLESTILRGGLIPGDPEKPLGATGYELLTTLAQRQLSMGQSVILDSVATTESIREAWRQITDQFCAAWRVIECVCSDTTLHKKRVEQRQRGIPGWYELEWGQVENLKSQFIPWNEPRLILDSIESFEKNLSSAIEYCRK